MSAGRSERRRWAASDSQGSPGPRRGTDRTRGGGEDTRQVGKAECDHFGPQPGRGAAPRQAHCTRRPRRAAGRGRARFREISYSVSGSCA